MPAWLAYPMLYEFVTRGMDADAIDEVDAILGDVGAQQRVRSAQVELILASGGEIG